MMLIFSDLLVLEALRWAPGNIASFDSLEASLLLHSLALMAHRAGHTKTCTPHGVHKYLFWGHNIC